MNQSSVKSIIFVLTLALLSLFLGACASMVYYDILEIIGYPKREMLVSCVKNITNAQKDAQEEFKTAMEEFKALVRLKDADLQERSDRMNEAYKDSKTAADKVSNRIDIMESVGESLFDEWKNELSLYENERLRSSSEEKLKQARTRYEKMLASMRRAESSMDPVLQTFLDNVLFLKHNLNARTIGTLELEVTELQDRLDNLLIEINQAISESDQFISTLKE